MRVPANITAAVMAVMALLAGAVPTYGSERGGNGPAVRKTVVRAANGEDSAPRQLERLVFLSHPYAWELQSVRDPERAKTLRWFDFRMADLVAMERKVSSRWPQEVGKLGSNDALIINYFGGRPPNSELENGPIAPLLRAAREHMGNRYLLLFGTPSKNEWGREIQRQLREKGYTYDPATVATESWGQSTEGCVVNFAAHFAAGMGLAKGFPMRYELTFPDAPFAMTGSFSERVALGNSDVSLYLSESKEGRPFAIFFPGVLRDGESNRYVEVAVDPASVEFTNKKGEPVTVPREEGRFRVPLHVDGYGAPIYIWAKGIEAPAFKAALAAARASARGRKSGIVVEQEAEADPAAGPSSRQTPEAIRALPSFGRIDWTVEKLPFVADGPRAGISGVGMAAVEGKIYLCGGFIPGGDETDDRASRRTSRWAHRYDPQAREWTRLPDVPGRREYTRAIAADGELYVLGGACQFKGGSPPYRPFGDCFRLDLSTANPGWESVASLAVPRTHMAVGRVGRWLVAAGGNQYDFEKRGYHSSTISGVTEVLDLEEPKRGWKGRTPIPGDPRGWIASAVCGERLYVLGGLTFSDRGEQIRLAQAVCYDPARDDWTDCTAPPVPISGWEAATFADRYLIAVGGVIGSQTDLRLQIWNDLLLAYDTSEDRWLKIEGPLPPGGLFNDSGVCILGDTIYVAGAEGPSGTHFNYWLVGKIVAEK